MTTSVDLSTTELSSMYETMCTAKTFDERITRGIKSGELFTVIWPSRGQEAISGAMSLALREDDRLVTTYRGLHDHISKGVPLVELFGEVLGTSVGASKGKGGTMHIACPEKGVMLSTGIVGSGPPVAVGLALAARMQKSDRVTAVCFGDGATNTGSFHEAMNLAATWQLPVVFICQNNLYAEMTPVGETMNIAHIADRAKGVGMPGVTVDGNDPVATYAAIKEAVDRGRSGGGPTFVECVTFRFEGHYVGDQQQYIPAEEMAEAKTRDPLVTFRATLLELGLTEEELAGIENRVVETVEEALNEAKASPVPSLDELDRDIYSEGTLVNRG
jgi:acetoin:2,6-dichlorophenolindophenol oxidoreductase subunit alpha